MSLNQDALISSLEAILAPKVQELGYDLLDVEYQTNSQSGGPVLRLFIENPSGAPISFADCVKVDHGVDPLIESPDFEAVLSTQFTLEVSSPGLDRPLKKEADYLRYTGKRAEIKTIRPLSAEEMQNEKYFAHHQKQKNFIGILRGFSEECVDFEADNLRFKIPFALINKAHLDIASQLSARNSKE